MAKYIAKSYLLHNGAIVKDGEEVELTDEQAKRLGDKIQSSKFEEDKSLSDYTVPELKEFAEQQGIEGYYDMKKDELIDALESE